MSRRARDERAEPALAAFERVRAAAWAEYERIVEQARAECARRAND